MARTRATLLLSADQEVAGVEIQLEARRLDEPRVVDDQRIEGAPREELDHLGGDRHRARQFAELRLLMCPDTRLEEIFQRGLVRAWPWLHVEVLICPPSKH